MGRPLKRKFFGTGEENFVGKATKYGKAGTLAENLTPEQMATVNALKAYSLRDINMARQAKALVEGMKSGKNAVELLSIVPPKNRPIVMETLPDIFTSLTRGAAIAPASLDNQQ